MLIKLCFSDFHGGDSGSARENLEANRKIIRRVMETASEEGLVLILGNVLPMVEEYTGAWLIWNHREYNRYLSGLADTSGGRIVVLDLCWILADPDGSLRPEYAADPCYSHLNEAAYDVLDGVLKELLSEVLPA